MDIRREIFSRRTDWNACKAVNCTALFSLSLLLITACSSSGGQRGFSGAARADFSEAAPVVAMAAAAMAPAANSTAPTAATALIIRSGAQELRAENVLLIKPRIEQITADAGGRVTHSSQRDNNYLHMTLRIPEPLLDQVMAQFATLAEVKSSSLSSSDVTDQVLDLQARLSSMRALRDRLRSYLDRTADLEEILKVERELSRVQADIERMEGTLTRLKSQVAMSTLTVQVSEKKKRWW